MRTTISSMKPASARLSATSLPRVMLPVVTLVAALLSVTPWAGSPLHAEEPKGKFEVHDVSLWILEPGSQQANLRTAYPSALPPTVTSGRTPPANRPGEALARRAGPINLITFHGAPATDLDVDLRTKAGTFLAHWPTGEGLPNRLRWAGMPGLELVEKLDDEAELAFVDSEHWIRQAREGEALYVRRGARSERFLAYDAELNLAPPIRLEGGPDKFKLINTSGVTVYDVLVSRGTSQGRRVAWLDVLPAATPAAPVAPAKPANAAADLFDDGKATEKKDGKPEEKKADEKKPGETKPEEKKPDEKKPAEQAPAAQPEKAPAETAPAKREPAKTESSEQLAKSRQEVEKFFAKNMKRKAPSPAAAAAAGVEITLSEPLAAGAEEAAAKTTAALAERLARAGLSKREVELFVANYRSLFFEGDAVVVACRLSPGAIDEKLPLSVFPEPTKMVRVAMVLLRNADPQLGNEVDRLVTQLGDAHFDAREAAQKRLLELGPLAFATLNKALSNNDLEIVIRAERILLSQNQTPNPQAQPKAAAAVGGVGVAAPAVVAPAAKAK